MKLDRAYERIRIFGLEHEHNYRQKLGITTEFYDFSEALQFKNFADGKYYQPEIVSPETGERIGNKRVNKCYPGFKANPQTLTCEPQRDESAPEPQTSIFRPESIFKKMGGRSDATSPAVTPTAEDLPDTTIKRIDITNWESVKTPGARKSMFDRILELDGKEQLKAALEVTSTLEEAKEFIKARQREADSPNERSVKIKNDFAYQGKSLKWYAHDRGSDISPQHLFTVQKFWGEPKLFPDNIYFITKDKFVIDKLNGSLIYRGVMDSDGKPKYRDGKGVLRSDDQYNACPIGRNNSIEFANNSEECKIVYEETNTGRGLKAGINKQLKDKEISQDHQEFIDSQTQPENQNINLDALKKFIIEEIKYNRKDDELRESRLGEVYGKKTSYLEAAFKSFIGEKSGNKNVELTYPGSIVDKDYSDVFGENTNPLKVFTNFGKALGVLGLKQMYVKVKDGLYIKISSPSENKARLDYVKTAEGLIVSKKFVDDILKAKEKSVDEHTKEESKKLFITAYVQDLLNNKEIDPEKKVEMIKESMLIFLKGRLKSGSEYDPENKNNSKALTKYQQNQYILPSNTLYEILRFKEGKFKNENKHIRLVIDKLAKIIDPSLEKRENIELIFSQEDIKEMINKEKPITTIGKTYTLSNPKIQGLVQKYISTSVITQESSVLEEKDINLFEDNGLNKKLIDREKFKVYENTEDILTDQGWTEELVKNLQDLTNNVYNNLFISGEIKRIAMFQNIGKPDNINEIKKIRDNFIKEFKEQLERLKDEVKSLLSAEEKEDKINEVFSECLILLKNAGFSKGLSGLSELHAICLASVDEKVERIIIPEKGNFEMYDFFVELKEAIMAYEINFDEKTKLLSLVPQEKRIESNSVKMPDGNLASAYTGFKSLGITEKNNPLTKRNKNKAGNSITIPIKNKNNEEGNLIILQKFISDFDAMLRRGTKREEDSKPLKNYNGFEQIDVFREDSSLKEIRDVITELTSRRLYSEEFQKEFLKQVKEAENPMHFEDFLAKAFITSCADIQGLKSNLSQILIDYQGEADPNSPRKAKKVKALDQRAYADLDFINLDGEILEVVSTAENVEEILKRLTALNIKIKRKTSSWGYNYKQDPQSDDVSIRTFSENLSKVIK